MRGKSVKGIRLGLILLAVFAVGALAFRAYDMQQGLPLDRWHTDVPHDLRVEQIDTFDWRVRMARVLRWFVPRANPDHEKLYPLVKRWLPEIDEDSRPHREIGLDEHGKPLSAAPDSRNTGLSPTAT